MQFEGDRDILTRPNFDVNIRLLRANKEYRSLVAGCVEYIIKCASTAKHGYKSPHGWSGANAGIPFNIIALATGEYFINPKILNAQGGTEVWSNCGSLTLPKSIKVKRWKSIDLEWYQLDGRLYSQNNIGPVPGYTIQHEIKHTQGVLITF